MINTEKESHTEKLYPVIRRAKTSLGEPLPENSGYAMQLAYCPVCSRRLSARRLDPKSHMFTSVYQSELKRKGVTMLGKPEYCYGCGNIIHPIS